eukprot:10773927-Alexandrium_andersonii.AAC.1
MKCSARAVPTFVLMLKPFQSPKRAERPPHAATAAASGEFSGVQYSAKSMRPALSQVSKESTRVSRSSMAATLM